MKKNLLTIFALLSISFLSANPIVTPGVALSELKFNDNGKWIMELQYFYTSSNIPIDSIWIKSSSGIAKLKQFQIVGESGILLVENDSLNSSLNINPTCDSIQIIYSFYGHQQINDPVTYGYANGMMRSPRVGQSIAATRVSYNSSYSLDKSPTIGAINDTIGMCGTINGHIYDKNNQLLTRTDVRFSGLARDFSSNSDGTYSARLFSSNNHINLLWNYILPYAGQRQGIYITPIDVSIEPDTVITVDIHLLNSVVDGIDEIKMNEQSLIRIFPNPIKSLSFNYEIVIPVKSSNSYIQVTDITGKSILQFPITENTGKINLPQQTVNGTYAVCLYVNNKNYSTSKMIIKK